MNRRNVFALVALAAVVMIWGCSPATSVKAPTTAELIGKWVFTSIHETMTETIHYGIPGAHDSTMRMDSTLTLSGTANYLQLNADITYSFTMPAMGASAESGTWSLSGSSLRMISSTTDTTNLSVSVSGNNGTFVNSKSERTDIPTVPGAYIQMSETVTVLGTKQ
jgi:hypothetical protein